jgi:hypothetical protein
LSTTEDARSAADIWSLAQPSAFCLEGLKKVEQRSEKCVEFRGEYVELSVSKLQLVVFFIKHLLVSVLLSCGCNKVKSSPLYRRAE